MGIRNFPVITLGTDGSDAQTVAGPGSVAIPVLSNGVQPKYLHVRAYNGATVADWISVTPDVAANNGALATGFLLSSFYGHEIILNVFGYDFIGYDEIGAAGSSIQLTPLADY
jgi:hypothetical protein